MKGVKRLVELALVSLNIKPYMTIVLNTGVACRHFKNGKIETN